MPAEVVAVITAGSVLVDIGRGLREAFAMLWDTLWALVAGFGLSGAVQAFVSRQAMHRRLGDHGPRAVGRASLYGVVSSSCSYAASALARSLFAGGADFVTSMVFMVASTNLVVELGVVLAVLLGWQFVAAELIGGVVMIGLLVIVGGLWLRGRVLDEARRRIAANADGHPPGRDDPAERVGWRRMRTRAGWSDAATYTISDLTMLRKELVVGFLVAGLGTVLVPTAVWNDLFLHGHGLATTLDNVAVGPLVAIVSFVCSVGNVPLAAALWKGGISFGGVVSFIFADLITLPLLLIYRKQYGGRLALRMLGVLWLVMSLAGLITQELLAAAGWLPTSRPTVIAPHALRFDATTVLDVVALVVLAGLYRLSRRRERLGGAAGYARDPVCGMQVETALAPASTSDGGQYRFFCSEHCRYRFLADPSRYATAPTSVDPPGNARDE